VLENVAHVLSIELICAAQALEMRVALMDGAAPGAGVIEAFARARARIPALEHDREPGRDLAAAFALVRTGALADLAAS